MSTYPPPTNWNPTVRSRLLAHWQQRLRPGAAGVDHAAGLTLIECLAAIVVVGLIGAAIAPVLVISVATRVQSQKSEQALSVAQSEIDRIRVAMEQGGSSLSGFGFPPAVTPAGDFEEYPGPDGLSTSNDYYDTNAAKARAVDVDPENDNGPDFAVQVYRNPGQTITVQDASGTDVTVPVNFALGIRVYDYNTVDTATGTLDYRQASIGLTSSQGDRAEQPLATLYTTMAVGEDGESLCNFFDYIDSTSTNRPEVGCD